MGEWNVENLHQKTCCVGPLMVCLIITILFVYSSIVNNWLIHHSYTATQINQQFLYKFSCLINFVSQKHSIFSFFSFLKVCLLKLFKYIIFYIIFACVLVYCTASGKTHFNMAFSLKNSNMLQLTKLYMKVWFSRQIFAQPQ